MSRPKRVVRFCESFVQEFQEWQNLNATISELYERYKDPDVSAYIESQNCIANGVMEVLCSVLKIKGKPDMEQVEDEYDYYKSHVIRTGNVGVRTVSRVKPKYKKDKED